MIRSFIFEIPHIACVIYSKYFYLQQEILLQDMSETGLLVSLENLILGIVNEYIAWRVSRTKRLLSLPMHLSFKFSNCTSGVYTSLPNARKDAFSFEC